MSPVIRSHVCSRAPDSVSQSEIKNDVMSRDATEQCRLVFDVRRCDVTKASADVTCIARRVAEKGGG